MALWPWQLGHDSLFLASQSALLATGAILLALSRKRQQPPLSRAIVASLAVGAASFPVLLHAEFLSDFWAVGAAATNALPLLCAALVAVGAADGLLAGHDLERWSHSPGRVLGWLGGFLLLAFFVWPTAGGTVLAEMSDHLRAALATGVSPRQRVDSVLTDFLLVVLAAATVYLATGAIQGRPHGHSRSILLLGIFAAAGVAGIGRVSTDGGIPALLVGFRGVALSCAGLAVLTASLQAAIVQLYDPTFGASPWRHLLLRTQIANRIRSEPKDSLQSVLAPYRRAVQRLVTASLVHSETNAPAAMTWRLRFADALAKGRRIEFLTVVVVVSLSLVFAWSRTPAKVEDWPLGRSEHWADVLYRDALPALGRASTPRERAALTRMAASVARSTPEISERIEKLGRLLSDPGYHRRAIAAVGDELNALARERALPYYLDVQVLAVPNSQSWSAAVDTYRIRASRKNNAKLATLWVESADLATTRGSLGFSDGSEGYGFVLLDAVERNWRTQLAPSLVGAPRAAPYQEAYGRFAPTLSRELRRTIQERSGTEYARAFDRYLGCIARSELAPGRLLSSDCPETAHTLEPIVVEYLALNVERHELQHMLDERSGGIPTSDVLRTTLPDARLDYLGRASAELSAYLAEIADGPLPHLSLAHLIAVATTRPDSAEAAAAELVRWYVANGAWEQLFDISDTELRARAARAYGELFDRRLERVDVTHST